MKTRQCQGLKCAVICAWLWLSGLLLMGRIMGSLGEFVPNVAQPASSTEASGTLQVFFLFYTGICVALYFLWRRVSLLNAGPAPRTSTAGDHLEP
ncbi:MAG: hypothetical protein C4524_05530 [Candidatus Zixiibacteriota bacterium]|nr:MAG: hypothetical protein C4524_05530 [candidate division Zixibacteria bacterium]